MQVVLLSDLNPNLLEGFQCGNAIIDHYFKNEARNDDDAVTYCFMENDLETIIALSSLSCSGVIIEQNNMRSTYPSVEIKMFAVNDLYKKTCVPNGEGLHWSDYCFDKTISLINEITDLHCGASRIILYAVPGSVSFYRRNHMEPFTELMFKDDRKFLEGCTPMLMRL